MYLLRDNDVTSPNDKEASNDIMKRHKKVAYCVALFHSVTVLYNKTRFFTIANIAALCLFVCLC